jgi:excinuclease ABC subunit A
MKRIEMNFLPMFYVTCDVCRGKRLQPRDAGSEVQGTCRLPICSTRRSRTLLPILENIPQIKQKLETLLDVGLGYIKIGQSSTTLSGGEAQRIKACEGTFKACDG